MIKKQQYCVSVWNSTDTGYTQHLGFTGLIFISYQYYYCGPQSKLLNYQ